MKDRVGCLGGILYLLMGIIQIYAIIEGVNDLPPYNKSIV